VSGEIGLGHGRSNQVGEKITMAEMDSSRERRTRVPPPKLSPFEGPTFSLATLMIVAGIAGAMAGVVVFRCLADEGIKDLLELLFIGTIGLVGGGIGGIYGGIVTGQIARVIFQKLERRYYQLAGALVTGALCGVVWVVGLLSSIF
jgi:prolipoprotein diacylglyceryltransferase